MKINYGDIALGSLAASMMIFGGIAIGKMIKSVWDISASSPVATNAPSLQIIQHSPDEVEVRDTNNPPPGYGVASDDHGHFRIVYGNVIGVFDYPTRAEAVRADWDGLDALERDSKFHVSEPPK